MDQITSTSAEQPAPAGGDSRIWDWFAILLLVGVFGITILMAVLKLIPAGSVDMVIGMMLGWVSAIVSFKWGSSNGSKAKDEILAKLASK